MPLFHHDSHETYVQGLALCFKTTWMPCRGGSCARPRPEWHTHYYFHTDIKDLNDVGVADYAYRIIPFFAFNHRVANSVAIF